MTTTTTAARPAKPVEKADKADKAMTAKPAAVAGREHARQMGREIGTLAVNVYERGIADFVAFEKDAAKITPYPWMRNTLTVSAGLIEDVGAAYVRTARQILR